MEPVSVRVCIDVYSAPRSEGLAEVAALSQLLVQLSPRSELQYDVDPSIVPEISEHPKDIALSAIQQK